MGDTHKVLELVEACKAAIRTGSCLGPCEALCTRIQPEIELVCRTFGEAPSGIEDIRQAALISIFESIESFHGRTEKSFWAWCKRIAKRRGIDAFHKEHRGRLLFVTYDELCNLVTTRSVAEFSHPGWRSDWEALLAVLRELSEIDFECLVLHHIHSLTYVEIAELGGLTVEAVRKRIRRAEDRIAREFQKPLKGQRND